MTIAKDHVVEIEYTLTDEQGTVLDTSKGNEPLAYLHGSKNIIPGLEKELEGKAKGDEVKVTVPPKEAYGEYMDVLVNKVDKTELSSIPNLQVGLQLQAQTDKGVQVFTVTEINDDKVTLDGNHPLAGKTLNFDVKVANVRQATPEEISHGHVHGKGGQQH